jgi:DMSO/TMAO reductase YedYZ molybdopterin-dependent catalytic subunit
LNKNRKIALTAAVIAVIIISIASTYYLTGLTPRTTSILPSGEPPQSQITVTGDIVAPVALTVKDLSQMPLTNLTSTIKGETASYVGVTLLELLNRAGAAWDAGYITLIASDGYNKTINQYQAYNSTQYPGNEIILAFVKNGKWITDTSEGPFKLITPTLASGYNIKCVKEINLQPWTITISGTTNPLVLAGNNITNYETETVQATFAPGGEPQRTSDWTGVSLWSVLQAGGIPAGATKVTVTAVDGYSRDYTITQVQDLGILVGYQENGQYLTPVNGQPYRLVVPTEDFKWGQYWVRWVTQITIS